MADKQIIIGFEAILKTLLYRYYETLGTGVKIAHCLLPTCVLIEKTFKRKEKWISYFTYSIKENPPFSGRGGGHCAV